MISFNYLFHFRFLEVRRLQEWERSRVFFSVATSKKFKCSECVITYNIDHAIFPPGCVNMAKGTFVAPANGFYYFQFHAMVKPHKLAKVQVSQSNHHYILLTYPTGGRVYVVCL